MNFKSRLIKPFIQKLRLLTGVYFGLILLLLSCHSIPSGNKKIFHYNEQSGIASLDPSFAKNQSIMWALHQVYNTLVEVDSNLVIQPSLARSWVFSNDRKQLLFQLRTDVYFQDDPVFSGGKGRKLTATDVVYSFQRIMDKNTASPGAWIFNNRVEEKNGFIALNDSTVEINLLKPFQPILGILSMQYCSIVCKEAVSQYGNEFRRHPVGTGPFQLVAWEEGQGMVLKRNEHYFEKDATGKQLPYLDGVYISFLQSKASEFLEFQQGKLDFINDIESSFKDELLTKTGHLKKEWEGTIELQKHPYLNIEYFGILVDTSNELVKSSPLKIKAVRQAINYAIDRNKLMLYLRNSIGTAATSGFVPTGMPSFDCSKVHGYHYDPEKAKQLLRSAGFPDGQGLPVIRLSTIPVYESIAGFVANELKQMGIQVQVETMQKSLLLEQTAHATTLFFRGSWIADYPDAENYLSVFYSRNPSPPNYTRFQHPEFDRLYEQALAETTDSIRYGLYRQMDQLVMDEAPVVPLWYDMAIHLVHKNIHGFSPNSLNLLELRKVTKD